MQVALRRIGQRTASGAVVVVDVECFHPGSQSSQGFLLVQSLDMGVSIIPAHVRIQPLHNLQQGFRRSAAHILHGQPYTGPSGIFGQRLQSMYGLLHQSGRAVGRYNGMDHDVLSPQQAGGLDRAVHHLIPHGIQRISGIQVVVTEGGVTVKNLQPSLVRFCL